MSKIFDSSFADRVLIAAIVAVAIAGGAFVATAAYAVYHELEKNEQWAQFVKDHDCKVVSRQAGTTSVSSGVALVGSQVSPITTVSTSPGSTVWTCDDGGTYER